MLYYESPYLTIDWDEQMKAVVMKWKGFVTGESFRKAVDKGLELLAAKRGGKWLADLTEMGVITQADQKWTDENWFPQAISAGVKFIAIVRPEKIVSQMSVRNVVGKIDDSGIESEYFNTLENAKAWLRTKQSKCYIS